jgi:uncharacterized membrane protein (UPF0136 family)
MTQLVNGQASKALVAVLTAVAAALPIYYGTQKWVPIVVMALGALSVWLVPNAPKPAAVPVTTAQPPEPPAPIP